MHIFNYFEVIYNSLFIFFLIHFIAFSAALFFIKKNKINFSSFIDNKIFLLRVIIYILIPIFVLFISVNFPSVFFVIRYFSLSYIGIFLILSLIFTRINNTHLNNSLFFFSVFYIILFTSIYRHEKDEKKEELNLYLSLLKTNNLVFEASYYSYPLYYYKRKDTAVKYLPYYIIDYKTAAANKIIPIFDLADYYGTMNLMRFINLPIILRYEEFEKKIDCCIFKNDPDRQIFEMKILNNPIYTIDTLSDDLFKVKRKKRN